MSLVCPSLSPVMPAFEPPATDSTSPQPAEGSLSKSLLKAGLLSFSSILVAEMGDKTQLATLLLSAETHNIWLTFSGAALALVLTSLVGVWAGSWVARRISPRLIKLGAGVGFVLIGGSLLISHFLSA